ncbi:class I SAM-dependent methyltransferase [Chitinophaga polysaccharea]|uniref:class I SAM-dependent methyltransferase n=1 Tax=Chitinophaga TaxID=79328 RepID=UPI00145570AA|nr:MULTISPECIES: class I SAM-dependent methyltransferase [Chitinophaga]NLR57782.1 class I SAM-dependent methyltransferase [Chitinophaga polysaccharea]NLU93376.1 class I SAM-dependent methyltransferase [Chitinophaga sp. Ak27]
MNQLNSRSLMAVEVFNKQAKVYQDKYMDVSMYHDTFDLFCNYIPKDDAALLDIACGPGNVTAYLLQKRPGFRILGIDLAPNMIELAKKNNPGATFELKDARAIRTISQQFDAIVCAFGLPYLSKTESEQLIADAYGLLAPGGVLYLSTMEGEEHLSGYYSSSSGDEIYIHYHQAAHLVAVLNQNDFALLAVQRIPAANQHGWPTDDLILIAKKR